MTEVDVQNLEVVAVISDFDVLDLLLLLNLACFRVVFFYPVPVFFVFVLDPLLLEEFQVMLVPGMFGVLVGLS